MGDSIKTKALALFNKSRDEYPASPDYYIALKAIFKAIEQHEATMKERDSLAVALRATSAACADHVKTIIKLKQEMHDFRQKVSDTLQEYIECFNPPTWHRLNHFIIPKPDPLVDVLDKMLRRRFIEPAEEVITDEAAWLHAALDALGFEIREKGQ